MITPPPVGERGILFRRFLSLFLCQQHYEKTARPICMKFSGKLWSDHGTTWLNFGSIRLNGSVGQRSICLLSPAIAQRTGVNKSVSFARWQQGAGFVVPRTTAYYLFISYSVFTAWGLVILTFDLLASKRQCQLQFNLNGKPIHQIFELFCEILCLIATAYRTHGQTVVTIRSRNVSRSRDSQYPSTAFDFESGSRKWWLTHDFLSLLDAVSLPQLTVWLIELSSTICSTSWKRFKQNTLTRSSYIQCAAKKYASFLSFS